MPGMKPWLLLALLLPALAACGTQYARPVSNDEYRHWTGSRVRMGP